MSKGHNSADKYSTGPKFKFDLRILPDKFHLKISMYNKRKLNPELGKNGMMEVRKGILFRGGGIYKSFMYNQIRV